MAQNKILFESATGRASVLYGVLLDSEGNAVKVSDGSKAAYATANYSTYLITATELGTASGIYTLTVPSGLAAGIYFGTIRNNLGTTAAETNPAEFSIRPFNWNGTVIVDFPNYVSSGRMIADVYAWDGGAVVTPASTGLPSVNATHAAGTAWNSGAIGASTLASDTITSAKIADGAIDAATLASDAGNKIADHVLRRSLASAAASSDGDAVSFRSLLGGIRKLVNRVAVAAGVLTVYAEDDTTSAATQTVTTDPDAEPINEVNTN